VESESAGRRALRVAGFAPGTAIRSAGLAPAERGIVFSRPFRCSQSRQPGRVSFTPAEFGGEVPAAASVLFLTLRYNV